jgi:hypothetical protein
LGEVSTTSLRNIWWRDTIVASTTVSPSPTRRSASTRTAAALSQVERRPIAVSPIGAADAVVGRLVRSGVPGISAFYGIVTAMYFDDHPPLHCHAKHGEHQPRS